MAKNPSSSDDSLDGMSKEVDRLLKQLPGADPSLRGSGPLASPTPTKPPDSSVAALTGAAVSGGPRQPTAGDRLGAWLRVGLGLAVGVLMTRWPYPHACGVALYLYLGAVTAVVVAGGWASAVSWKLRMGRAHVVSLGLILWGLVLAAQQVLPRIGYAAAAASWRCL